MAKAAPPDEFHVPTLTGVQRFFGISYHTAREWKNQGMPVVPGGGYDLCDVFQWWIESDKFRFLATKALKSDTLSRQKLAVEVEIKRLKLQRDAGDLIEKVAAMACIENMFHRVRTRLEAIPAEVGSSLPSETRAAQITDMQGQIRSILRELESWGGEDADGD